MLLKSFSLPALLALLIALMGCASDPDGNKRIVEHRRINDLATPVDAKLAGARHAASNALDLVRLHKATLDQGIAFLDKVPETAPGQLRADWGAHRLMLQAWVAHDLDLLQRLSDPSGLASVNSLELNALDAHMPVRQMLNRALVVMDNAGANPDYVLANLPPPRTWARTLLAQRGLNGGNVALLKDARINALSYSFVLGMMIKEAKDQGNSEKVRYFELERQEAAIIANLITVDLVAFAQGQQVSEERATAAYDIVEGSRPLLGDRLAEAFGPVATARRLLTSSQAAQLQGTGWTDAEAYARFRGWWKNQPVGAQPGWLDTRISESPERLSAVWWMFRAMPSSAFSGSGAQSLPPADPQPGDAEVLSQRFAEHELKLAPASAPAQPNAGASETPASNK